MANRKSDIFRGDRLRQLREAKHLGQIELAQACGIGEKLVYRYENKQSEPSAGALAAIADYLDTTTDYLLGLTHDPHRSPDNSSLTPDEQAMLAVYRREGWIGVARISVENLAEQLS